MKKYLLMLLAATTLSLGFTACGDDDKEDPTPSTPEKPAINFDDYANCVGIGLNAMMSRFGEPTMNMGTFYMYTLEEGSKTAMLTFIFNPENSTVYSVIQTLNDNAYKAADIKDYLASKYHYYGAESESYEDEDGEVIEQIVYIYGNTEKKEDATLLIKYDGENSVGYYNPKNEPAEIEPSGFDDMTPEEVVDNFLGENIEDILEEYDGFTSSGSMYMAFMEDAEYLMGFALNVVDDTVTSIILLYNEDLTDEDIIEYYKSAGYTITDTGEVDEEEGTPIYIFSKPSAGITIVYSCSRGVVTATI